MTIINYLSRTDPTKYRVRVYDLVRNRLDPKPVTDPREPPDELNGLPVTRVASPDGRWAHTLYDRNGEQPFIHALDTRDRKAFCIDLHDPSFGRGAVYDLRLAVAAGGRRLDIRRKGATVAAVTRSAWARAHRRRPRRRPAPRTTRHAVVVSNTPRISRTIRHDRRVQTAFRAPRPSIDQQIPRACPHVRSGIPNRVGP